MSAVKHRQGSHGRILSGMRAVVPSIHRASLTPELGSPSVWVGGFQAWLEARGRSSYRFWGEDLF
eukprot:5254583-Pleurochrysis_carterae.AAC.1